MSQINRKEKGGEGRGDARWRRNKSKPSGQLLHSLVCPPASLTLAEYQCPVRMNKRRRHSTPHRLHTLTLPYTANAQKQFNRLKSFSFFFPPPMLIFCLRVFMVLAALKPLTRLHKITGVGKKGSERWGGEKKNNKDWSNGSPSEYDEMLSRLLGF